MNGKTACNTSYMLSIECLICNDNLQKDCELWQEFKKYKLSGFCESSDNGKKCYECKHISLAADDCIHNTFAAALYRFERGITEDPRKFEPREDKEISIIIIRTKPEL
jgi:hypothetical protein